MARSEIMQKIEDLSGERGFWPAKDPTTRQRATTGGSRR